MTFLPPAILAALAALAMAGCARPEPEEGYCAPWVDADAVAQVTTTMEPVVVRHTKTRVQIDEALAQSRTTEGQWLALGATTAAYTQASRISALNVGQTAEHVCGKPRVSVALTVKHPVVDIAREFAPGSCLYALTLEHEMRHVAAYEEHLAASKEALTAAIAAELQQARTYFAQDSRQLEEHVNRQTDDWLVPLVSAQLLKGQALHEAIDSTEEYERLTLACP